MATRVWKAFRTDVGQMQRRRHYDRTQSLALFSCLVFSSLSRHALLTLVRALIVSKVDYCNIGTRWYPRPAATPAAVRLECRRLFGFLSEAVRTHNPIAS